MSDQLNASHLLSFPEYRRFPDPESGPNWETLRYGEQG